MSAPIPARGDCPRWPRAFRRSAVAAAALAVTGAFAWLVAPLPPWLANPPEPGAELTDRRGRTLRETLAAGKAHAKPAPLAEFPEILVRATLAAEDKRFFQHPGVDFAAIARAAWSNATRGRVVSGGSTLTQQLVKISRPGAAARRRTWRAKAADALLAIKLELHWPKERILEACLNRLDYGGLRVGAKAAARFYFDKPPADLTPAEAALLAALPRSPVRLNPHADPEAALAARSQVLWRMRSNKWITDNDWRRAAASPLGVAEPPRIFAAPHFVDLVLERLGPAAGAVRTTLDLDLNRFAERALRSRLASLKERRASNGAAVVLDNRAGAVLALVGSENYFAPGCGQVNGATAMRSPGSALKPFAFALAFQCGFTPASVVLDEPMEFPTPTGLFRPVNFNRRCLGPVSCRDALAQSLNIPAVRVLDAAGGPGPLADLLRRLGISTLDSDPARHGLGLVLGNAGVRLLELANAYAALARGGLFVPWRAVSEPPSTAPDAQPVRVLPEGVCHLVLDILGDNIARAPAFGPASPLALPFPAACKTGTSTDFRDNWAFGCTPEFTVGVWIGNFDGSPMDDIAGISGAAPVMRDILRHLHDTRGTTPFPRPAEVVTASVDPATGLRVPPGAPGARRELFLEGAVPPSRL